MEQDRPICMFSKLKWVQQTQKFNEFWTLHYFDKASSRIKVSLHVRFFTPFSRSLNFPWHLKNYWSPMLFYCRNALHNRIENLTCKWTFRAKLGWISCQILSPGANVIKIITVVILTLLFLGLKYDFKKWLTVKNITAILG